MIHIAIVGAGMAGLAAARALRQSRADLTITIFEQGSVSGGRVATGRRPGFAFDHGAQNMRAPAPEIERLLTADLPAGDLVDIGLPVWVFDGAGAIAAGDPAQNAQPKWAYRAGNDHLAELLAAGLEIRYGSPVERVERAGAGWRLDIAAAQAVHADIVLLTQPAPQVAALLAASEIDATAKTALVSELGKVAYRPCISVALAYAQPIVRPFYALVNADRAHPVAWLALEHAKGPERCPPGHSLLVVQMAPRWSAEHWETPDDEVATTVAALAGALLGERLSAPLWHDIYRWQHALPDGKVDAGALDGAVAGLFFAGDYTAGLGRVHLAIESGWRTAATIARTLGSAYDDFLTSR